MAARKTVLDEEEYSRALDTIIKNKYFPELKAYENLQTDEASEITSTWSKSTQKSSKSSKKPEKYANLNLKVFFDEYTSEDNFSFEELAEKAQQKHKEKYPYLYSTETPTSPNSTTETVPNLDKNQNTLFFLPIKALPASKTDEDLAALPASRSKIKRNPAISIKNTRFNNFKKPNSKPSDSRSTKSSSMMSYDPGYQPLYEPSPNPGVDVTPLVTWGEIESTPVFTRGNKKFKIQLSSPKEEFARSLSLSMLKSKTTPKSPIRSKNHKKSSAITPLTKMSPAVQKLASKKLNITPKLFISPKPSPKSTTPKFSPKPTPKKSPVEIVSNKRASRMQASDFFN